MSIPPESIEVGRCYLTDGGRIRRVIRLMPDGRVQFEHRGARLLQKAPWVTGMQEMRSFAFQIEREVPCDWTPEADEVKP